MNDELILIVSLHPVGHKYRDEVVGLCKLLNIPDSRGEMIWDTVIKLSLIHLGYKLSEQTPIDDYSGMGKSIYQNLPHIPRFIKSLLNSNNIYTPEREVSVKINFDTLIIYYYREKEGHL